MGECIFCKIVDGSIPAQRVYEDANMIAFKDINPKADTHILAIPRKHIDRLDAVIETDKALVADIMSTLPAVAKTQGLTDFRVIINNGAEAGQEVFHLHIHVLGGGKLPGF